MKNLCAPAEWRDAPESGHPVSSSLITFGIYTKTVGEHPMVLFIVVIVETFIHVQHKSNTCPLDLHKSYMALIL